MAPSVAPTGGNVPTNCCDRPPSVFLLHSCLDAHFVLCWESVRAQPCICDAKRAACEAISSLHVTNAQDVVGFSGSFSFVLSFKFDVFLLGRNIGVRLVLLSKELDLATLTSLVLSVMHFALESRV